MNRMIGMSYWAHPKALRSQGVIFTSGTLQPGHLPTQHPQAQRQWGHLLHSHDACLCTCSQGGLTEGRGHQTWVF